MNPLRLFIRFDLEKLLKVISKVVTLESYISNIVQFVTFTIDIMLNI